MNSRPRSIRFSHITVLVAALLLTSAQHGLWAQSCPSITLSITRTGPAGDLSVQNQNAGLTGDVWVFCQPSGVPTDLSTGTLVYYLKVYGLDGVQVYEQDGKTADDTLTGEVYFDWQTASMRRPWGTGNPAQNPAGDFQVEVDAIWTPNGSPPCATYQSPRVTRTVGNPLNYEVIPSAKLNMVCGPNDPPIATGSETDPMTGNQSWSIPVTSWPYQGNTYGLTLTYSSVGLSDPKNPDVMNLAGLSEKNSRWTHNFAMWVTLPIDETGAGWAVLHRGGHAMSFKKPASGNTYTSLESFDTLQQTANTESVSVTYPCNGSQVTKTLTVPVGYVLTDRDGTQYVFNSVASNYTSPIWQTGECTAIPYYVLTTIIDRWGHTVNITWSNVLSSGTAWRVTQVSNPNGPTLTLAYSSTTGLMQSARLSTEPAGVTHTLGYTGVQDETGTSRQKLTALTLHGPAGAATRTRSWSFVYRDPATENTAYSGSVTGDLVIRKTQPDGLTFSYVYDHVTLPRATSADYDGRLLSVSWPDNSEGTNATRTITRAVNGSQVTMTFPGGVQTQYTYTGSDLTSLTELPGTPAARTWAYQYDSYHNLAKAWSPMEPTSGTPLIENDYTEDSTGHITHLTTWQPIDNGTSSTRISTDTDFNSYNLPTRIVAHHDPDPNAFPIGLGTLPHYTDQVTTFGYDENLTPALGNLTSITRTDDSGLNWTTSFQYDVPNVGVNGPPGHITNDVGGQSAFTYDPTTFLPTSSASPVNTIVGTGSPDYAASTTQISSYEEHGLPTLVVDPLQRPATTSYQGDGTDATLLDAITTFGTDGTWRIVQLDAMDRVRLTQDERGIIAFRTYNPQNQVKTVTRNAGDPNPANRRVTTYYYNDQGDVSAIDPPNGFPGRVVLDYRAFGQDGNLITNSTYPNGYYVGRLGRIAYPDGHYEVFGYNTAGELIWKLRRDGTVVSLTRDVEHRVKTISYPATAGAAAFTVTRLYDEFGRPKQLTDLTGTTFTVWDALNRPAHTIYPSPQKSLDFSYQADATYHRWTTTLNVSSIGVYQFSEDSKGRPYQVTNAFSQLFQTEYYLDGQVRKRTWWPNGVTEQRSYNPRGFLSQIQIALNGGAPLDQFNYKYGYNDSNSSDYDGTGRVRREVEQPPNAPAQTHAFFFDNLYQLVGESDPALGTGSLAPPYDVNYSYDLDGNRTSRSQGSLTDYYGVDTADRLLWVNRTNAVPTSGQTNPYTLFTYNPSGQVASRDRRDSNGILQQLWLWWDADDRLRTVTTGSMPSSALFFDANYNGDGIRTGKDDLRNGTWTRNDYSSSPFGLLWSSTPNVVYTPGFGHRSNGINSFYQVDWLGSTRYVTDITGTAAGVMVAQRYDAFGQRDWQMPNNPNQPTDLQWAGAWGYQTEWNNTPPTPGLGLDYLQQRYYDPVVGRFVSPDPIGLAGGMNLYEYAGDDPVGGVDPGGTAVTPLDALWVAVDLGVVTWDGLTHASGTTKALDWTALGVDTAAFFVPGAPSGEGRVLVMTGKVAQLRQLSLALHFAAHGSGSGCPNPEEGHHMIPREVLNKHLPPSLARQVRGARGSPNVWKIPALLHAAIHAGPGGGLWNSRWIDELANLGPGPLSKQDVLDIRDLLAIEFGLDRYAP